MRSGGIPDTDAEARVAARLGRQAILSRADPPEFHMVVDEMALRRVLGGPRTMARQLRHLRELAEEPNVTLGVLPFAVGGHSGLDGSFVLVHFRRTGPVVHLEHKISGLSSRNPTRSCASSTNWISWSRLLLVRRNRRISLRPSHRNSSKPKGNWSAA